MAPPGGFDEKQWGSKGERVYKYQKFGTKNKYQFNFFLLKRKDGNLRVCVQHVREEGIFLDSWRELLALWVFGWAFSSVSLSFSERREAERRYKGFNEAFLTFMPHSTSVDALVK